MRNRMNASATRLTPFLQCAAFLFLLASFTNCKNYKAARRSSFSEIKTLKNNTLLVRLHTSEHRIAALEKRGFHKEANEEREKVEARNAKTVEAFKSGYSFSKVYFFYSPESEKLKNKDYEHVALFDAAGNAVQDRSFLNDGYLVATFGAVYQDQLSYTDNSEVRYAVAGTQGVPALVIMDRDYLQLNKPFPYRIATPVGKINIEGSVSALDERLKRFYARFEKKRYKYGL